ncbi:MAG: hypothetical protein RJB66_2116 [Pseudomonadota bacterium]|jgi:putative redox protein
MAQMQSKIRWVSKLLYQGESRDHRVLMDAKKDSGGQDLGMTPKELVLTGLCGCTGMDVISLLTSKFKLPVTLCEVEANATPSEGGHPVVWTKIELNFLINGEIPEEQARKAVELSMTRYCGVSAMLSKACPILYNIHLNGQIIASGEAKF